MVCSWLHIWDRQRLLGNPVRNNESFELELSGVWEPSNALKEVIRIEKPKIVFLMETKLDRDWMKRFVISVVLSKV